MVRPLTLVLVSLLTASSLAACAGSDEGGMTAAGQTTAVTGDPGQNDPGNDGLRVIVVPGSGVLLPEVEIGCPSGPWFPASALDDVPPVEESGLSGALEAMATFLGEGDGEGSYWPQEGWRVLHATESEVLLVHIAPAGPVGEGTSFMTLEGSDGAWRWAGASGAGRCPLQTALPPELNTVEWELDPDQPAPTAQSTALHILATERECVSGQAMGERLLGPEVVLTETEILVAFAAERPPGDQSCPGNPSTSVVVELGEPLGDRVVRDGLDVGHDITEFLG